MFGLQLDRISRSIDIKKRFGLLSSLPTIAPPIKINEYIEFALISVKMSQPEQFLELFPWIDSHFVQKLVNKSKDSRCEVQSFQISDFDNNGQNFGSRIFRLSVELCLNGTQLEATELYFVKMCLKSKEFDGVMKESLLFEKEIEVYSKILPAAEKLLESIDMPIQFAPK